MDRFTTDVVVAGAGVVGLAIARALAMAGREVLIVEKNGLIGEETSARNSEVIHAGIYYDPGSLKARHCLEGRIRLYAFCRASNVPHRQCGKLIVSSNNDDSTKLDSIAARAEDNGVTDLHMMDRGDVANKEPALNAAAALYSPSTGIIDSHSYMLALLAEAEAHGAQLALHSPILRGAMEDDGRVTLDIGGADPAQITARSFVNCAGLWATGLTNRIQGLPPAPELALVKGSYFSLNRKAPFSHLIYPVPQDGGLGVHLTLDLAGRAKFGPDTEWLSRGDPSKIDYRVSPQRREDFATAIRSYWPDIRTEDLTPDYSGVRPKNSGASYPDFQMIGPDELSTPHALLYGIESPGLTASLSIAAQVRDWLS